MKHVVVEEEEDDKVAQQEQVWKHKFEHETHLFDVN